MPYIDQGTLINIPSDYPALGQREQITIKQLATVVLTQAMYDALPVKDPHTQYLILSQNDYVAWIQAGGH